MLETLSNLVNAMSITSEYRDGWKHIETTIGTNGIVTLNWPKLKLKIISFKMPDNWDGSTEQAEAVLTIDTLYYSDDTEGTVVWRTNSNHVQHNWDSLRRVRVSDIVDRFFDGSWTPPWKCGFCSSRHAGKLIPKY
jgi:hypothetical protein